MLLRNMYWYFMWDRGQPLLHCTHVCTSLGALDRRYVFLCFVCVLLLGNMYWYSMRDTGQALLLCTAPAICIHVSAQWHHSQLT